MRRTVPSRDSFATASTDRSCCRRHEARVEICRHEGASHALYTPHLGSGRLVQAHICTDSYSFSTV